MNYNTQVDDTLLEMRKEYNSMKHYKSPGYDNILYKCILYCKKNMLCIIIYI